MLNRFLCRSGGSRFVQFWLSDRSKSSSKVQAAFEAYKETELPNLKVEVRTCFSIMASH